MNSSYFWAKTALFGIVLAFVLTLALLVLSHIDMYMKLEALNNCSKISHYQKTDPASNTTVWYPVVDAYKDCISRFEAYSK